MVSCRAEGDIQSQHLGEALGRKKENSRLLRMQLEGENSVSFLGAGTGIQIRTQRKGVWVVFWTERRGRDLVLRGVFLLGY